MPQFIEDIRVNFKVTYAILIANIVIWIAMEIAGGSTNSNILIDYGALYRPYVLAGEVWRMISGAFLHIGIFHLLINSYSLLQLGTFVEEFFGRSKLISVYVLTAFTASIFSLFFSGGFSAGASGAIFGLTGLLLGNAWAKKVYSIDLPIDERQLLPFVLFNLYYGFIVPGIDNAAHIGGLFGGIVLGYVMDHEVSFDPNPIKRIVPKILGYVSVSILIATAIFWFINVIEMNIH